jgi:glycosyltransferase involved in cell wall biosynthesis
MCAFNAGKTINESITSILNQSFSDFELIVVNDGSTDNTKRVVTEIDDPRIVLIDQENLGPSIARDNGIRIARGEFIAILDADDIAFPERFIKQLCFLTENPEYVLVGSNAEVVDRNLEYIYTSDLPLIWTDIIKKFPDASFYHSSVMFRKEAYENCGGYYTLSRLYIFEDALLFNKMKVYGKMANLGEPLIKYRLMPDAASTKSGSEAILLNKICKEIISEGFFSEENQKLLEGIRLNKNQEERDITYHLHVAKKYLLNNYNPGKIRENIFEAIKIKPLRPKPYFLLLLSIVPTKFLTKIYQFGRR